MKKQSIHKRRADIAEHYLERIGRADDMNQVRVLVSQWEAEAIKWHPVVLAGRVTQRIAQLLSRG